MNKLAAFTFAFSVWFVLNVASVLIVLTIYDWAQGSMLPWALCLAANTLCVFAAQSFYRGMKKVEIDINKQLSYEFAMVQEKIKSKKDSEVLASLGEWLEQVHDGCPENPYHPDYAQAIEHVKIKLKELQGEN